MLSDKEIKSLITLLDDEDEEVLTHVKEKLISLGQAVIPILESEIKALPNQLQQAQVAQIVGVIRYQQLIAELTTWYQSSEHDLLGGVCIIARYRYPHLDQKEVLNQIDQIRLDIWLEMHYDLSPYEKVRIINHALYTHFGFRGNTDNYHAPENSFINDVLENKRGNPIMLAVVYMLLAQRLHLPVFGVNLPQHFVCAYKEENPQQLIHDPYNLTTQLNYKQGRVLFYINAFNNGAVFSKANLEQFLRQLRIEQRPDYFEPCSNLDIVKRILRNLVVSYEKTGLPNEADDIKRLLLVLGENYFSYNEEAPPEDE